jgi:centrosomal protein CEP41
MIIIYHKDERASIPHASLLIQKGYENIFLLTGGIDDFVKIYPEKCEGPGVQALIEAKIQDDEKKKEGNLLINF